MKLVQSVRLDLMKFTTGLGLLGAAFLTVGLAPRKAEGRKLAIVVGVSGYLQPTASDREGISSLRYAHKDAERMRAKLESLGWEVRMLQGFPDSTSSQAKRDRILSEIKAWENTKSEDSVLFYFSGHGMRLAEGDFLCPADFTIKKVGSSGTADDWVADRTSLLKIEELGFERIPAQRRIVILDACRNRPKTFKSGDANGQLNYSKIAERVRSSELGRTSSVLMFSCLPNEMSQEDPQLEAGLYTTAILKALESPRVLNADSEVSVSELNSEIGRQIGPLISAFNSRIGERITMSPDSIFATPPQLPITFGKLGNVRRPVAGAKKYPFAFSPRVGQKDEYSVAATLQAVSTIDKTENPRIEVTARLTSEVISSKGITILDCQFSSANWKPLNINVPIPANFHVQLLLDPAGVGLNEDPEKLGEFDKTGGIPIWYLPPGKEIEMGGSWEWSPEADQKVRFTLQSIESYRGNPSYKIGVESTDMNVTATGTVLWSVANGDLNQIDLKMTMTEHSGFVLSKTLRLGAITLHAERK